MMSPGLTVGAYAAAGALTSDDEPEWYGLLGGLEGVSGLEVPFKAALHPEGVRRLAALLPGGWNVVVTMLPLTFVTATSDPRYGLASTDAAGRHRALTDAHAARAEVLRLNDALGYQVVTAIQLHSAPSRTGGPLSGVKEFTESLRELSGLEWDGAELLVEHCDAPSPHGPHQKGYLGLADETRAVADAGGVGAGLGQSINWGRSAIEGRSAATPLEHIAAVREAGTLRGLMFSGAAAVEGPFGAAWRDVHNPVASVDPCSLLDAAAIGSALAAAPDDLLLLGAKVKAHPTAVTIDERLATLSATVRELAAERAELPRVHTTV